MDSSELKGIPGLEERFWSKVLKTGDPLGDCWIWTASGTPYGAFTIRHGYRRGAHRVAYVLYHGDIPEGLDIDHLCRNTRCVNPEHLEAVDHRTNLRRGRTVNAANLAKTHCKRGHPFSGDNLYVDPQGKRYCRTCHRLRHALGWTVNANEQPKPHRPVVAEEAPDSEDLLVPSTHTEESGG